MEQTIQDVEHNALAQRARIILRCAEGADEVPNSVVAKELGVTDATVGKWRSRYIARGLAGLLDEERCGAPRTISDEKVEEVITKTLESLPSPFHAGLAVDDRWTRLTAGSQPRTRSYLLRGGSGKTHLVCMQRLPPH